MGRSEWPARNGPARDEVWSLPGMIAFTRWASAEGLECPVEERIGENPVANQNPAALPYVVEDYAAAEASGFPSVDPADVSLKRQDGKALSDLPDESASAPRSLHLPYIFLSTDFTTPNSKRAWRPAQLLAISASITRLNSEKGLAPERK